MSFNTDTLHHLLGELKYNINHEVRNEMGGIEQPLRNKLNVVYSENNYP